MGKRYQKTINLPKPTSGQAIIEAMQAMTPGTELIYQARENRGEPKTLKVGFSSPYTYEQVVILTGEKLNRTQLQPEAVYERIAVGLNRWSDEVYAVIQSPKEARASVNRIAENLEARLK